LGNSLSKDFKLFTIINKRIIVKLFNYLCGAGQAGAKPGRVGITSSIRQSLAPNRVSMQLKTLKHSARLTLAVKQCMNIQLILTEVTLSAKLYVHGEMTYECYNNTWTKPHSWWN